MSVIHAKEVENSNSDGWPFKTWVTHESHTYPIPIGSFVNAEVNWSPDSTAFFVTYSDTGAVGQYHLLVYRLDKDEIHSTEPIPDGGKLFKPNCMTPGLGTQLDYTSYRRGSSTDV